jgi:hypothetical protein
MLGFVSLKGFKGFWNSFIFANTNENNQSTIDSNNTNNNNTGDTNVGNNVITKKITVKSFILLA